MFLGGWIDATEFLVVSTLLGATAGFSMNNCPARLAAWLETPLVTERCSTRGCRSLRAGSCLGCAGTAPVPGMVSGFKPASCFASNDESVNRGTALAGAAWATVGGASAFGGRASGGFAGGCVSDCGVAAGVVSAGRLAGTIFTGASPAG
jgi:hypothetical protein